MRKWFWYITAAAIVATAWAVVAFLRQPELPEAVVAYYRCRNEMERYAKLWEKNAHPQLSAKEFEPIVANDFTLTESSGSQLAFYYWGSFAGIDSHYRWIVYAPAGVTSVNPPKQTLLYFFEIKHLRDDTWFYVVHD